MKLTFIFETPQQVSAWGEPIPNFLDKKKISNKKKKLFKLGASLFGVSYSETEGSGE